MLFGLALVICVSGLVLSDVIPKLRTDLIELDSTIEKLTPPSKGGEGHR